MAYRTIAARILTAVDELGRPQFRRNLASLDHRLRELAPGIEPTPEPDEPHESQCAHCGDLFPVRRSDARYCSPRCRVAAKRLRDRTLPMTGQDTGIAGTLYTFGYSGLHDGDELRDLLGDRASLIYDVRLHVYSGNRAFSLNTRATVEAAGYRYIHLSGLGNLAYKTGGIELKRPSDVSILVDALRRGDVAIMCVCADATTCHRRTVADLVRSQLADVKVIDLQRADVG